MESYFVWQKKIRLLDIQFLVGFSKLQFACKAERFEQKNFLKRNYFPMFSDFWP